MWTILKLRLRFLKDDWKIIAVMTALSLVMVYAMTSTLSGSSLRTLYVVDQANNPVSETFVERLADKEAYRIVVLDQNTAQANVKEGKAVAAIQLQPDFSADNIGALNIFTVKQDVEIMNIRNLLGTVTSQLAFDSQVDQAAGVLGVAPGVAMEAMADQRADHHMFTVKERALSSIWDNYDGRIHGFFGFMLLFAAYTIVFGAGEILNDKRWKTWQRLLVSPISTYSVLLGTIISTFVLGGIQLGSIFLGGQFLYGFNWGPSLGILLVISAFYIFALSGLGMFLAAFLKNHGQLSAVTPVILTSFAMLGGCMWPLEIVTSKILLGLSNITPHKWALEAMKAVTMQGAGWADIQVNLLVLGLMGFGLIALGAWRVKTAKVA